MAAEAVFMKGGNLHRLCDVTLADDSVVTVEPYAIFTSLSKRKCFCWHQASGEDSGWKYPAVVSVKSVKVREDTFSVRNGYDPFNKETFPVMHYSIPTQDGRQRWMDARPAGDKQDLRSIGGDHRY